MQAKKNITAAAPVRRPAADGGSILIIVIWWLVLLSTMAIALYVTVSPRLGLTARLQERAKAHYAALAALQVGMAAVAADDTPGYDGLTDAWSNRPDTFQSIAPGDTAFSLRHVAVGPGREEAVLYGLSDEQAKININRASADMLRRLFEIAAELPTLEATPIAAAIIDWRDTNDDTEPDGAESLYYQSLYPPYTCKNRPFQVLEELLLVRGITPAVFARVRDHVTLYGTGAININTADTIVLQCLGLSAAMADAVVRLRTGPDGAPGTGDDRVFERVADIVKTLSDQGSLSRTETSEVRRALSGGKLTVRSDIFRGELVRQLANSPEGVQITFVFNRNRVLLQWREL